MQQTEEINLQVGKHNLDLNLIGRFNGTEMIMPDYMYI